MKSTGNWIRIPSLILLATYTYFALAQDSIILTIKVEGANPGEGRILLSVFASEQDFLRVPMISLDAAVNESGNAEFVIGELEQGNYALSAIYDQNSNGKLDTNFLGIPSERVGMSNNPSSWFGPPGFGDAVVEITTSMDITIAVSKAR